MGSEGTRKGSGREVAFEPRLEGGEGASLKDAVQVKNILNAGDGKGAMTGGSQRSGLSPSGPCSE